MFCLKNHAARLSGCWPITRGEPMARHRRNGEGLPFDKQGGVIAIQRRLIQSRAFLGLSPQAKALIMLMQSHWSAAGPIGYGVREAEAKIPCSRKNAMKAFNELQEAGFIVKIDESLFSSRVQSKTRTWRLTWMPCWRNRAPTNDWERSSDEQNKAA